MWDLSSYYLYLCVFTLTLFSSIKLQLSMFFRVSNLIKPFQTDWFDYSPQSSLFIYNSCFIDYPVSCKVGNGKLLIEGIAVEYFPNSIDPGSNKKIWISFIYKWLKEKYVCDSHAHMFDLLNKLFDSGILVCGILRVWEYTNGCATQYRCALVIYLMNMLPY